MECSQFRQSLDLTDAIDSADPLFQATRQHVDNCALCAQKLSKRLEVERSIKFTMDTMASVPETLVSSVITATRSVKPHSAPWRSFVTTAASMTLAIGISVFGFSLWGQYQRSVAVDRLCVLSIRNHELDNKPEYVSNDKTQVSRWLSMKLNRLVRFPEKARLDNILGASRSALGPHIVGAVKFMIDGKKSSLFSYYPKQFGIEGAATPPQFEMGYTVAVWNESGVGYSLVSEAKVDTVKSLFIQAPSGLH